MLEPKDTLAATQRQAAQILTTNDRVEVSGRACWNHGDEMLPSSVNQDFIPDVVV